MSRGRARLLAAALLACGLGACAGAPVVGPTQLDGYTSRDGALFFGGGQLVLVGSAGEAAATQELAAVAARNLARGARTRTPFLLTPYLEGGYAARNRVVVVIGGANGTTLCSQQPAVGGEFRGGRLTVTAAACNGERRLSATRGSIEGIGGPGDPRLAGFFSQLGSELFPVRNPRLEGPDRQWTF